MPIVIRQDNFEQEVMAAPGLVLLDVYATWCGPCQQMEPVIAELEKEMAGTCKFAKLNVEEARDLSIKLGVTSVPTFIFVLDGQIKDKVVGYMGKLTLKEKLESYLK